MLNDKEVKLLRLAMDDGAQPGEIDNAAAMLIRKLRKRRVSADDLIYMLNSECDSVAEYGLQIMPFGKYEGIELMYIPHDYLEWVLENCRNISLHLRRAICECLEESA